MRTKTRAGTAAGTAVLLLLALTGSAQAGDDSEGRDGGLEVEVRPAIAEASDVVTVAANFEVEVEDDEDGTDRPATPPTDRPTPARPATPEPTPKAAPEPTQKPTLVPAPSPVSMATPTATEPVTPPTATFTAKPTTTATAKPTTKPVPSSQPAPVDVALVVDFGDGTPAAAMSVLDDKGRLGSRDDDAGEVKALARHAYAADGDYLVTVTATPAGGVPVTVPVQVKVGGGSARLGGKDRHETANRLAREDFPTDGQADAVLLARSDAFADALAAASLAVLKDAPVLLTTTADLPPSVATEISRALGETGTVCLLGGEKAISPAVEGSLTAAGYVVERIAGTDRVETALQLAAFLREAGVEIDSVVLANSANFPDALAGAAFAARTKSPVLLTPATGLDPRVAALLAELGDVQVYAAGGRSALGEQVLADVEALGLSVRRLAGRDRYDTSATVARTLSPDATSVLLTTGRAYPDALSGAAAAGRRGAPVLLVDDTLPEPVRAYLTAGRGRIEKVYVLGGDAAVSPAVLAEVRALLGL